MFNEQRKSAREQRIYAARIGVLALLGLCALGFVVMRIAYLTMGRGNELYDYSEYNMLRRERIPAPRGEILDRYGRLLAASEPRFHLYISPFKVQREQIEETLRQVGVFYPNATLPPIERVMRLKWYKNAPKQILLASGLTLREALPLMERQGMLPGLHIEQDFARVYPHGRAAAFLTGYVGRIPPSRMAESLEMGYDRDDRIGMEALERRYEPFLRGEKGVRIVRRDAFGFLLDSRIEQHAVPGGRLVSTVDIDLQTSATLILEDRPGVILVMDPRTGEVLSMVSMPNYDANRPENIGRNGDSGWNKAVRAGYAPGSTFKLVTAAAYLMAGFSPERSHFCYGSARRLGLRNRGYMQCDRALSHQDVNLTRAITVSCNMFFFDAAENCVGLPRLIETASMFGFGQPTNIPLLERGESPGKLGVYGSTNLADLHMMAIGQGRLILTSPIQMINAYATLANGGNLLMPLIINRIEFASGEQVIHEPFKVGEIPWTASQHKALMDGFRAVVENKRSGTGRHAGFHPDMKVAGKTSTAERITAAGRVADAGFICFSPWDNPEVCVYVLLEEAGHGGEFAAPLAKKVLEAYYRLKEQRTEKS